MREKDGPKDGWMDGRRDTRAVRQTYDEANSRFKQFFENA